MRILLAMFIMAWGCFASLSYASELDRVTLTPAEMQKLKKYFPTEEAERVIWKGEPITIRLPIAQEKRIIFPSPVTVDARGALSTGQLRLLNNDKSLYLTALQPFAVTRIYVTVQESGKVVLLDLDVTESASSAAQTIDVPSTANPIGSVSHEQEEQINAYSTDITAVGVIRFAWKQVYAPEHLLKKEPQYTRVPLHSEHFIADLVYGDRLIAHPDASWFIGSHYVTVVSLQNKYPHIARINLSKDLCGDWEAATLYPQEVLKSNGKWGDAATLILVSKRPFSEAIGVCHGYA